MGNHRDKTGSQLAEFALRRQRMVQPGLSALPLGNFGLEFEGALGHLAPQKPNPAEGQ